MTSRSVYYAVVSNCRLSLDEYHTHTRRQVIDARRLLSFVPPRRRSRRRRLYHRRRHGVFAQLVYQIQPLSRVKSLDGPRVRVISPVEGWADSADARGLKISEDPNLVNKNVFKPLYFKPGQPS